MPTVPAVVHEPVLTKEVLATLERFAQEVESNLSAFRITAVERSIAIGHALLVAERFLGKKTLAYTQWYRTRLGLSKSSVGRYKRYAHFAERYPQLVANLHLFSIKAVSPSCPDSLREGVEPRRVRPQRRPRSLLWGTRRS